MKFIAIIYACVGFLLVSCFKEPADKLFIKSVEGPKGTMIDWYVYGKLTSYAPDYLQISTYYKKPFFKSFYLTDVHFRNDSLFISIWKNNYDLDKSRLNGVIVYIDTLGEPWNDATSRIERLKRRGVNILKPNFVDTYCEYGECDTILFKRNR